MGLKKPRVEWLLVPVALLVVVGLGLVFAGQTLGFILLAAAGYWVVVWLMKRHGNPFYSDRDRD